MRLSVVVVVPVVVAALTGAACSEEKPQPTVVSPAQPPPPPTPPVKDAVVGIYRAFAADPAGYDRTPVLSRFYMTDNARIDADCAAGKAHPRCVGDRFACLPREATGKGTVQDAVVTGESPGRSASVRVTLAFDKVVVKPDVDVVFEDGAWKVDQVRCDVPTE
jgi:hypothetical protein